MRSGSVDVIIVDSTDPVGPAVGLFSEEFYSDCQRALSANGVLIVQSESPLYHMEIISSVRVNMNKAGFPHVATLDFPQCSYPSGWWSATLASKNAEMGSFRATDSSAAPIETQYYNSEIHAAALAKPAFMKRELNL